MSVLTTARNSFALPCLTLLVLALGVPSCRERAARGPAINFDETDSELGQLPPGQDVVEHEFIFRNIGDRALTVAKVVTQCSCVTTAIPSEPIEPSGSGRISARFRLKATTGPQTTSLLVFSNDQHRPVTRLSLTASMKVDIGLSTDKIDLGWVTAGESAEAEFFVVVPCDQRQRETELVSFETSSPDCSVTVLDRQRRFNQWDGLVQVTKCVVRYAAPRTLGRTGERIVVTHTGKLIRKEIPLCVKVVGRLQTEPESILLSDLPHSAPIARTVAIRATDGPLPAITQVTCSSAGVEVDSLESCPDRQLVHLRILPAKLPTGIVREEVQISTDSPDQPTLCIPILGWLNEEHGYE